MNWKVIGILLGINVLYTVLGGIAFHYIEEPNEAAVRSNSLTFSLDFLKNYSCVSQADFERMVKVIITAYDQGVIATNFTNSQSNWDISSAIFFSSTVVTTIGYGNISPATPGGQAFCAIFALIGVPMNLVLLAGLGGKMARVNEKIKNIKSLKNKPAACMTIRLLVCVGVGVVGLLFIPSAVFVAIEGWSLGVALYYCIITLTTVGFGDYVAGLDYTGSLRGFYRLTLCIWIIVGLAWVGWLIGDAAEFGQTIISKAQSKKKVDDTEKNTSNGDMKNEEGDDGNVIEVQMNSVN